MIVLMHIVVLVVFDHSMRSFVRKEEVEIITYLKLMTPDQVRLQPAQSRSFSKHAISPVSSRVIPGSDGVAAVPEPKVDSPKTADSIDWNAAATAAAKQVVRNVLEKESKRSLDSNFKPGSSNESTDAESSIRGGSHPPGSVVNLGGGVFQTWVSTHCYISSEQNVVTGESYATEGMLLKYRTKCIEPQLDESDMPDQLKPEYLKKPVEEICSKIIAGCEQKK